MALPVSRRGVLCAAGAAFLLRPRMARAGAPCLDGLLRQRRMVRRFRPDPVADDAVRRLLSAARRAPSAGHTQPWAFVVVRDAERRRRLAEVAHRQMFVAEAPVVVVACADLSRSRARYGARGDRYAIIDTSFASLSLLLAALEAGLGACFVGAFEDAEVSRLLALPVHVQPLALIPIGRPAESPSPLRLRPLAEIVHDEQWRAAGKLEASPDRGPRPR